MAKTQKGNIAGTLAVVAGIAAVAGVVMWSMSGSKSAADQVYVKPGDHDEMYAFISGGHAGNVYVYGIPSGRMINTIPVFSPYSKTGWGYDEDSKKMMGGFTWGDAHHPQLSQTDGKYDGRWLFINDNANNRIARISLKHMATEEILGPIPNIAGVHAGPWITPNTEYAFAATRFSVPIDGKYAPVADYAKSYDGAIAGIKIAKDSGKMNLAWQIQMPPINMDLASSGKGKSDGYVFFTSYNTEKANTTLEVGASQHDRDLIAMVDWRLAEKLADEGKGKVVNGAKVLDPVANPGLVYYLPCPKSPHGVDVSPDGKYIVGAGKLAPIAAVHDIDKIKAAIQKQDFEGKYDGVPVLKYTSIVAAEVPVGLGPLHTQFDGKGYAYTSLFVDSQIAKWKLGTWEVVDKIPVTYNVGHLAVAGGDSMRPFGKYMLSLNKMTKDRFLPTGPAHPTNAQLIDITGNKMKLLLDFPTTGEPHYGVMIPADLVKVETVIPLAENHHPRATKEENKARIERKGNRVDVYLTTIRTHFKPDIIDVQEGDDVYVHVTSLEQDDNIAHGFAIIGSNVDIEIAPGETKTVYYKASKPGVYPFYCSNFCSALHQEMSGYVTVKPRG